jgi:hypothetical protein
MIAVRVPAQEMGLTIAVRLFRKSTLETRWEKVNTAAVGMVLGVSIGASCFALPAFADFLVSSIYIFCFQKNHMHHFMGGIVTVRLIY